MKLKIMIRFNALLVMLLLAWVAPVLAEAHTFGYKGEHFLLDGKPFRIFSGEMHYNRIPRAYWQDRLKKARAMGLNTVCTYVFWNQHEPRPGEFHFEGNLDLAGFIRMAQAEGLWVILRPGPYVCSEWDFGGLPAWLLKDPELRVRGMYGPYLSAARRYLLRLGEELKELQCQKGGPIISLQVENEYGSFANDKQYLHWLASTLKEAGFSVLFTTSDGPADYLLESGTLADVLPVVNFGSEAKEGFMELEKFRKNIPQMCGEYWCGWFTQWGHKEWGHSDTAAQQKEVLWMLENGKSFNFYMFHGGTNFGFYAGANYYDGKYFADITSYDYAAPLSEDGTPTEQYRYYRELLGRYLPTGQRLPPLPPPLPVIAIPAITVSPCAPLFARLGSPILSVVPRPMEYYDQDYGYILYRTRLIGPKKGKLTLHEVHDYARVYLDGKYVGKIDRRNNETSLELPETPAKEPVLDILVEAMGRINFGFKLLDRKGITETVTLKGVTLMNWEVYPLPMDAVYLERIGQGSHADINTNPMDSPYFFKGTFELAETGDTFLDMSQWQKGCVWINGINLGRYWSAEGPQLDLYVPGCWLKKGVNEILIFDLEMTRPAPLKTFRSRAEIKGK